MTPSARMEEDQSPWTEKILNLTLEIICLLARESFPSLKSGGHMTIAVPPPHPLISDTPKRQVVLEATQKMLELLMGEGEEFNVEIKEESEEPGEEGVEQWAMADGDIIRTIKEEEILTEIGTGFGPSISFPSATPFASFPDCTIAEDNGIEDPSDETSDAPVVHPQGLWTNSLSQPPSRGGAHAGAQQDKRFICPECGKCFTLNCYLQAHLRCHTGKMLYSCPECGKCFQRCDYLSSHLRMHTDERPYRCAQCGKSFADKTNLQRHQRSHTVKKLFPCPECGKGFASNAKLTVHVRLHNGEKPYVCSECHKGFRAKAYLVDHQRTHTGERPFSCTECEKRFGQRAHLILHRRSHTGEKPFSCPECGKCYSRRSYLTVHRRCHSREKP